MAYKTEELEELASKAIRENKLIFIEETVSFLPCHKSTFYEHFPVESDGYKRLFALIEKNRVAIKATLRGKWYKSTAPALQLALYKLTATKEEQRALSMQTHEFEVPEDTEIKIKIRK